MNAPLRNMREATQAPFAAVPPQVRERLGSMARLGVLLIVLGFAGGALSTQLMFAASPAPPWPLAAVALALPALIALLGANMVSAKYTAGLLAGLTALVRAVRGKNGTPAAPPGVPTP